MRRKAPPEDAEAARARALRLLSQREHGARELQRKLATRGLDRESAATLVGELAESGWQSDERYVASLIRGRVAQGYGPLRIGAELSAQGIERAAIAAALSDADHDWNQRIAALYARRFAAPPRDAREHASRYRFLAQRGFTTAQIRTVLDAGNDPDD